MGANVRSLPGRWVIEREQVWSTLPTAPLTRILFGETIGEIVDGQRTAAMTNIWGGQARARGDIPFKEAHSEENKDRLILGDSNWSSVRGFGSKHEEGVVFAFSDGSVHVLPREIEMETFYALIGMGDGEVVDYRPR